MIWLSSCVFITTKLYFPLVSNWQVDNLNSEHLEVKVWYDCVVAFVICDFTDEDFFRSPEPDEKKGNFKLSICIHNNRGEGRTTLRVLSNDLFKHQI